jgi:hypothetical protein
MSTANTNNDVMMNAPTERMHSILSTLVDISTGKTGDVQADISGAYPVYVWNAKDSTRVTPAKARAALKRYVATARAGHSAGTAISDQHRRNLTLNYRVGGKNPRTTRLWAYALNSVYGADKRSAKADARSAALVAAAANGGVWFAAGMNDKDGNPVQYADEQTARKAWVRHPSNYGANWWEDKGAKAGKLAEAVVSQGTPAKAGKTAKKAATPSVSKAQLVATCKALGLPHTGTVTDLRARINGAL